MNDITELYLKNFSDKDDLTEFFYSLTMLNLNRDTGSFNKLLKLQERVWNILAEDDKFYFFATTENF